MSNMHSIVECLFIWQVFARWGNSLYPYPFPGKGESLKQLQDEILQKSEKLNGLDAKLKDLLEKLRKKAHDLSICQG